METLNIAIPESLKVFALEQAFKAGFGDVSQYIGELIRADQRQAAEAVLEAEIIKGLRSGESTPMMDEDWRELHARIKRAPLSRPSGDGKVDTCQPPRSTYRKDC
ncbi:MAG TPA: hypothetical protein VF306_05025 [Pirellulales bacterium]